MATKNPRNRKNPIRYNLPLACRERGIVTQKQLVAALMPYMEWITYDDLLAKFEKIVTWQKNASGFRNIIFKLKKGGYIEAKHGDPVPAKYDAGFFFSGPPSYRRIRRDRPAAGKCAETKRLGICGDKAEKNRALIRAGKQKKKKSKLSRSKLTLENYHYIIDNVHGATQKQLAEMFGTSQQAICEIQAGVIPRQIKAQLARSRLSGTPADI